MKSRALFAAIALASAAPAAQADTYKWVDEKGQVNYSNVPPPAVAGKAQPIEDRISVMGMDPAVRAWAERRFAAQAYADEMDWQRRQQAAAAMQYGQPAGGYGHGFDDYYSSYPYGYGYGYYPGYVRRPFIAAAFIGSAPRVTPHGRFGGSRGFGSSRGSGGGHRSR